MIISVSRILGARFASELGKSTVVVFFEVSGSTISTAQIGIWPWRWENGQGNATGIMGWKPSTAASAYSVWNIFNSVRFKIRLNNVHSRRKYWVSQCSIVTNTKRWFSWWTLSMVWLQVNACKIFSFTAVKYLDRLVAELLTQKKKKIFVDNWVFSFLLHGCIIIPLPTPALSAGGCIQTNKQTPPVSL